MKIPLFDVDGTLVKGFVGIHGESLNEVFSKVLHISASYDEINVQGMIDPQIILEIGKLHGVTQEEVEEKLPEIHATMRNYILEHQHEAQYDILPGVKELFELLKKRSALIGLLTGNVPEAPEMKLNPSGLWQYIDFGAFGSEAKSFKRVELVAIAQKKASDLLKRPVKLDELAIIGDTPKDIFCARDGSIASIGVATGTYTVDDLKNAGADLVVSSLEEKEPILAFLGQ